MTTIRTFLLTTNRSRAKDSHPHSFEGRLRRHPEGGAGSGVLRRRLVTAGLGRPGTPPARHYDLAARSSLCPIRCPPKLTRRRAPVREARPRVKNRRGGAPTRRRQGYGGLLTCPPKLQRRRGGERPAS